MRQQYRKQKRQKKRTSVSWVRSDESGGRGGAATPTNELAATPRRGKGRQPSRLPKSEETEGTASPPAARTAALTARATATPSRREPESPRTTTGSDVRLPTPNARGPVNPSTSDEDCGDSANVAAAKTAAREAPPVSRRSSECRAAASVRATCTAPAAAGRAFARSSISLIADRRTRRTRRTTRRTTASARSAATTVARASRSMALRVRAARE